MTLFNSANRSPISGVSRISISSAVLDWQMKLRPGVFFGASLDFAGTDAGSLESVEFTNLANDLSPTAATFITAERISASNSIVFYESCKWSDMVRYKIYD